MEADATAIASSRASNAATREKAGGSSSSSSSSSRLSSVRQRVPRGPPVKAWHAAKACYFSGQIVRDNLDETFDILFDDGQEEKSIWRGVIEGAIDNDDNDNNKNDSSS